MIGSWPYNSLIRFEHLTMVFKLNFNPLPLTSRHFWSSCWDVAKWLVGSHGNNGANSWLTHWWAISSDIVILSVSETCGRRLNKSWQPGRKYCMRVFTKGKSLALTQLEFNLVRDTWLPIVIDIKCTLIHLSQIRISVISLWFVPTLGRS